MPNNYEEKLEELQGKKSSFNNEAESWHLRYLDSNNHERIVNDVNYYWRNRQFYEESDRECHPLKEALLKDYKKQKNLLIYRLVILLTLLVIAFLLGNFVGIGLVNKMADVGYDIGNLLRIFWKEIWIDYVRSETIEAVLKLNSFVMVLVTILSILVKDFNVRSIPFIVIVTLCAITLMFSSVLGLISVNNTRFVTSRARIWSYRLALLSLVFFIAFIGYLFVALGFLNAVSAVVETIKVVSNSTVT